MLNSNAKWIWYPGDFEIHHALRLNCRREERGYKWPAFWRLDDCWHNVMFYRKCVFDKQEHVYITGNGIGYFVVDGKKYAYGSTVTLESGEHIFEVLAAKTDGLPSVYIQAGEFSSNELWKVSCLTNEWLPSGCNDLYVHESDNPEIFKFSYETIHPVSEQQTDKGILYDFGLETFAKLYVTDILNREAIRVFYGESIDEATDTSFNLINDTTPEHVSEYEFEARAFRYIFIPKTNNQYKVHAEYEYNPYMESGAFRCSDNKLNKIWDIAAYTLHLNNREFILDGIKRDRWIWSGDAYQSYLVNYYLFFDIEICKRTIIALRGKDPVTQHINTIMDYSFYWIMSVWDYYVYTKDIEFIRFIFPRMQSLMSFCLSRTNEEGFMSQLPGDWIFIDWADMDKTGAVCAEQMLFVKSLEAMAECSKLIGEDDSIYLMHAKEVRKKIDEFYWNEELGVYIDSYESGKNNVTRHANIFALIFSFADERRKESIVKNVILNKKTAPIKTPYFKFYELDALCQMGYLDSILEDILEYWGGMIDLGATTFWEEYDPTSSFPEHYEMYGEKYGKSLCHAWGASPVYILGRYFLGVKPIRAGYTEFEVSPRLGNLEWIEGKVLIPGGSINVYMDKTSIRVSSDCKGGTLVLDDKRFTIQTGKTLELAF